MERPVRRQGQQRRGRLNSLQAFINAVEAQSENQIDVADTDYLIGQALSILDALGCE